MAASSFAFHTASTLLMPRPLWNPATSLPCPRFCSQLSALNQSAWCRTLLPLRTLESWRVFAGGHVKEEVDVGVSTVIKRRKKVLHFVKYQGLGNDFLLVDNRGYMVPKISPDQAIKLCSRKFGVGADGVIFVLPGMDGSDYSMRIFNSDGSEPEMCGNGIRCMAHFVAELENTVKPCSYNIHTAAGPIIARLREDGQVVVDMGPPFLKAADVPTKLLPGKNGAVVKAPLAMNGKTWMVTCVSMGNPHCVTFGEQDSEIVDVDSLPLEQIGPLFEHHPAFPARTNTEFVQVLSPSHLRMRVWERGAGATLACGTGACAVVVAGVLEGRTNKKCIIDLPGGQLEIEWMQNNHLYMTGPAEAVFEGGAFL